VRQVFHNLEHVLASVGATFEQVVQFTTYLVHSQDIETFMAVRRELFAQLYPKGDYPPNTLLVIDRLVREEFLIEVEAVAALP
jgi:enamine deaminase RidA (YjgF/YER057c/UK114 family)